MNFKRIDDYIATEIKAVEKPNYTKFKNEELTDELFQRKLDIPLNDDGKLIRKHALQMLIAWDEAHPEKYRKDPKVRVIFSRPQGEEGKYLFIGLNGRGYQIPYNVEVVLPASVVRVADDAIAESSEYTEGPDGRRFTGKLREQCAPYTFISVAKENEEAIAGSEA